MASRGFRAALRRRDFRLLAAAQAADVLGEGAAFVAMNVIVWERSRSASAVAALNLFRLVPFVVVSAAAGAIADRFDRRRLLVLANAGRALLVGALLVAQSVPQLELLWAAVAVLAALHRPTLDAAAPAAAGDDWVAGLSLMRLVEHVGGVVGPVAAAFLLRQAGARAALAVDAGALIAAALLVSATRLAPAASHARDGSREALRRFARDVHEGFAFLRGSPALRYALGMATLAAVPGAFLVAGTVVYADEALGAGGAAYGWMMAARAVGGVACLALLARHGRRVGGRGYLAAVVGLGAGVALFALHLPLGVLLLLLVGLGAAEGAERLLTQAFIVAGSPDGLRGRLFGFETALTHLGWMAAYPIAGALLDRLGPRSGARALGLAGVALALAWTAATRGLRALREMRAASPASAT
jgi:NRE family putative nickel resistance protein-like MFS transporter